jgi:hypothetical protein
MPSFRKRHREPDEQQLPSGATPSPVVEQAAAVPADPPSMAADAPPAPNGTSPANEGSMLRARLAEIEAAERLQRAQINSQMVQEPKPPAQPQLSEKDYEFLGERPGVERDPRLAPTAQALGAVFQYGSDAFYRALRDAFPITDYRRVEPQADSNGSEMLRASEPPKPAPPRPRAPYNGPPLSAPVSREAPMASGMRPSSQQSVRLSPDQRDIASSIAASRGISQKEAEIVYARELIRMNKLKASGQIQDEG